MLIKILQYGKRCVFAQLLLTAVLLFTDFELNFRCTQGILLLRRSLANEKFYSSVSFSHVKGNGCGIWHQHAPKHHNNFSRFVKPGRSVVAEIKQHKDFNRR